MTMWKFTGRLNMAREMGLPVDGHAPGLTGEDLKKYIQAGITTDHECSDIEEALEKISGGMKILIREGSAARNLDSLDQLISLYPEKVMLCTDDLHPETLAKGHINKIVARLVGRGTISLMCCAQPQLMRWITTESGWDFSDPGMRLILSSSIILKT